MNAALLNKGAMATSKLEDLRKGKEREGNEQEAENTCHRGADQSGHARLLRVSAVPAALLGKCS